LDIGNQKSLSNNRETTFRRAKERKSTKNHRKGQNLKITIKQKGDRVDEETVCSSSPSSLSERITQNLQVKVSHVPLRNIDRPSCGTKTTPPTNITPSVEICQDNDFPSVTGQYQQDNLSFPIPQRAVVKCHLERWPCVRN
jgi:hypothetical protein